MSSEVSPGVHIIQVPMPDSPLGFLNAWLLRSDQGCLLVDTGWNDEAAWHSLQAGIRDCGVSLSEVTTIVVTHIHPDHYGLTGRLSAVTPARLVLHPLEQAVLLRRSEHSSEAAAELSAWFRSNGMDVEPGQLFTRQALEALGLIPAPMPTCLVEDGEHLVFGDFDLQVLLTPGHICLHDQHRGLLFCGDHILAGITPKVSLQDGSGGNPLRDYLQALDRIAGLEIRLALPGHGQVITDIHGQIERIRRRHQKHSAEVLSALQEGPLDACRVAEQVRWHGRAGGFNRLPLLHRRWALTETLAHLEYLRAEGRVHRLLEAELYIYSAVGHSI